MCARGLFFSLVDPHIYDRCVVRVYGVVRGGVVVSASAVLIIKRCPQHALTLKMLEGGHNEFKLVIPHAHYPIDSYHSRLDLAAVIAKETGWASDPDGIQVQL